MRLNEAFPAKEFLNSLSGRDGVRVRARLLLLAQRMADEGKLVYEVGHWLKEPYQDLFEFKPYGYRFLAFKMESYLYVTNGAKKAKARKQQQDYDIALSMRQNFVEWQAQKAKLLREK